MSEPADVADNGSTIYVPTLIIDGDIVAPGQALPFMDWLDAVE